MQVCLYVIDHYVPTFGDEEEVMPLGGPGTQAMLMNASLLFMAKGMDWDAYYSQRGPIQFPEGPVGSWNTNDHGVNNAEGALAWPAMARTVWGDADHAASPGWVGELDTYRARYWSTFARDDGAPVMALDLADLACPHSNGAFSVLGHSREELLLGPDRVVVAAAELEATLLAASADVIDAVVVALPDRESTPKPGEKATSLPIACLVLPEDVALTEELTNALKRSVHISLGASCVPEDFVQIPAIPRTHNAKPMRNVVQRLFLLRDGGAFNEVSEIANASCLLELKAAIDEWRFQQALPQLDERC